MIDSTVGAMNPWILPIIFLGALLFLIWYGNHVYQRPPTDAEFVAIMTAWAADTTRLLNEQVTPALSQATEAITEFGRVLSEGLGHASLEAAAELEALDNL